MKRSQFSPLRHFILLVELTVIVSLFSNGLQECAASPQASKPALSASVPMKQVITIDGPRVPHDAYIEMHSDADQIPLGIATEASISPLSNFGLEPTDSNFTQPEAQLGSKGVKEGWNYVAVFDSPCHFKMTGTGRYHQTIVRDSLVIYEGMQIAIQKDGRYRLRFQAEIPRTAVILRLQFVATTTSGSTVATLTLPPITFDPSGELGRHRPGQTVTVQRDGASYGLKQFGLNPLDPVRFHRTGVARFGSKPEKGEYSILPVEQTSETSSSATESE